MLVRTSVCALSASKREKKGHELWKMFSLLWQLASGLIGFLVAISVGRLLAESSGYWWTLWVPVALFVKGDRAPWPCLSI